nr:reverse transcriptase domain-containing protein [Tanacetum cinerariifolium]
MMADQRTMAELLRAPIEGYVEAIVVPLILAKQFELKHSLINMMTSNQFFGLEKDNPHDHIRCQSANKCCDYRHDSYSQTISSNPTSSFCKIIEEIYVTCGGAQPYYQCIAVGGNNFLELWDNIQGYVAAAAVTYNQGNFGYRPPGVANQIRPPGLGSLPSNTIANPKGELKAITTQSGIVLDRPYVPIHPPFINPKEGERVEGTLTDQDLAEYTIKVPPPFVQKPKPPSQKNFFVHQRDPLHPNIPYPSRMYKQKQQEKDEV